MGLKPLLKARSLSAFSCSDRTTRSSGAALVVVLLSSALLTVLITAFLVLSSHHSALSAATAARERAGLLTETAWRTILDNLRAEMLAGSINPQVSGGAPFVPIVTPEGAGKLLFPSGPWSAVPGQTLPGAPPNLLKWSCRDAAFYTERVVGTYPFAGQFPAAPPAAPVSTQDPSLNGKVVSASRWNATRLLSGAAPVPDWILISSKGSPRANLLTNATDPVVGRYAFQIFDVGGLADVSVAGFPSTLDAATLAAKGSPRLVDLRMLLAAAGMSGSEATLFNDAFVRWRDAGVLRSGSFPSNYQADLWLRPFGTPSRVSPGNRALPSRSALIRMVRDRLPGNASARERFLQYVTVFSRALEQPSFAPPQPGTGPNTPPPILARAAGGNDGAGWDTSYPNFAQHLNPPFLQVRVKKPFLRADGSLARVREPLVKRRFPLSRLAEVGVQAVAAPGSRVERLFGLSRSTHLEPWVYRPNQTRIYTLNEVANLPPDSAREPDFFELLKAAIYSGCLATSGGTLSEEWMSSLDCAVIQIGANLIDQADTDGFPTRLAFDNGSGLRVFSGIENLPYFSGIRSEVSILRESIPAAPFVPSSGGVPLPFTNQPITDSGEALLWQAVSLWNPHALDGGAGARPAVLRLVVQSDSPFSLSAQQEQPMHAGALVIPGDLPDPVVSDIQLEGEQLKIETTQLGASRFHSPLWIESPSTQPDLKISRDAKNLIPEAGVSDFEGNPVLGVGIINVPRIFSVGVAPNKHTIFPSVFRVSPAPELTYRLEYQRVDAAGNSDWVAYDEKKCPLDTEFRWGAPGPASVFPDPRTPRLGPTRAEDTHTLEQLTQRYFQNNGSIPGDYPDADGVIRRAMGAATPSMSPLGELGRPILLNRPFHSVGEMACAFSGAPWKQLDFTTPESGFAGLLDVFCIAENSPPTELSAGRINLNTRQLPVLEAAISGVGRTLNAPSADPLPDTGPYSAESLAQSLLAHTARSPLRNPSEFAGRWVGGTSTASGPQLGSRLYDGYAAEPTGAPSELVRHAAVRALAEIGDTRVWNLLLDVIVQTGRYPAQFGPTASLRGFIVEAERRVWVHLAIDRLTGELLDSLTEFPED